MHLKNTSRIFLLSATFFYLTGSAAYSQQRARKFWYLSWGYNSELWMPSNIQVSQNALKSNFILTSVSAHDEPDWNTGIFNKPLAEPQYNIRLGFFLGASQLNGFELSFDHTKYTTTANQPGHISGIVNGNPVDEDVVLTPGYFSYVLHNGANHLMVNYVRKMPLFRKISQNFSVQGLLKTGAGIMVPHAENTIMGNSSDVGPKEPDNWIGIGKGWWRYGGYTAGIEYGIRLVPVKYGYIELTDKIAYANLSDIPVYKGIARQELWMMEGILSVGIQL